jgi:hypothetical protein
VTTEELRIRISKKYKAGQTVVMKKREPQTGRVIKKFKVKILGFYPRFVLTIRNGFNETFTYYDFYDLTRKDDAYCQIAEN